MINPCWPTVLSGKWLYAGSIPCSVRIVRGDVIPGSGDCEDPENVRDDRVGECYYIVYECCGDRGRSIGGIHLKMADAVAEVAKAIGDRLEWDAPLAL